MMKKDTIDNISHTDFNVETEEHLRGLSQRTQIHHELHPSRPALIFSSLYNCCKRLTCSARRRNNYHLIEEDQNDLSPFVYDQGAILDRGARYLVTSSFSNNPSVSKIKKNFTRLVPHSIIAAFKRPEESQEITLFTLQPYSTFYYTTSKSYTSPNLKTQVSKKRQVRILPR